jgi:hypothetical protein
VSPAPTLLAHACRQHHPPSLTTVLSAAGEAQESKMGADRAALVAMFSEHRIMLRGGREQADALMDDLIAWKGQQ